MLFGVLINKNTTAMINYETGRNLQIKVLNRSEKINVSNRVVKGATQ